MRVFSIYIGGLLFSFQLSPLSLSLHLRSKGTLTPFKISPEHVLLCTFLGYSFSVWPGGTKHSGVADTPICLLRHLHLEPPSPISVISFLLSRVEMQQTGGVFQAGPNSNFLIQGGQFVQNGQVRGIHNCYDAEGVLLLFTCPRSHVNMASSI